MNKNDKRLQTALFRYGVIARLVSRRPKDREEAQALKDQVLSTTWEYPDGTARHVPESTVRHWVRRYRKQGFNGLFDDIRNDKGSCKAIPDEILDRAEELRKENPRRSVQKVIRLLESEGIDTSSVKERTLARQLLKRRATRKWLKKGVGSYRRWEQLYVNDMWQSDVTHGIYLRDPQNPGKAKKTKLIAFLDDASRLITHAEFYWDEKLPSLLDCFAKALLSRGRPVELLLDNGSIYRSTGLANMCAELGIERLFCRPRAPQGKGKIERFFKTVQDDFFNEAYNAGIDSLSELNALFQAWLKSEYHEKAHSELEMTPLERWAQDFEKISIVTPDEIRSALMLRESRVVHLQTATVSVDGRTYQASADMAGQCVEVRWSPTRPEEVELWMVGEFIESAPEATVKPWVEPKTGLLEEVETPSGTPIESSRNYLQGLVTGERDKGVLELKENELLTARRFVDLFNLHLERVLMQEELDLIGEFFRNFAPLRTETVATTLERAVTVKGSELHLRYYLEQLEQAIRKGGRS